jgi:hypothetical protein
MEYDEVARFDRVDRAADRLDDARAFMPHDQGQWQPSDACEHLDVALTDTCREQADHDFVIAGSTQLDVIAHMDAVLVEYDTPHRSRSSIGGSVQSYALATGEAEQW